MENLAIERCAYCRQYVPVTWVAIGRDPVATGLAGRVAVCESCRGDGR